MLPSCVVGAEQLQKFMQVFHSKITLCIFTLVKQKSNDKHYTGLTVSFDKHPMKTCSFEYCTCVERLKQLMDNLSDIQLISRDGLCYKQLIECEDLSVQLTMRSRSQAFWGNLGMVHFRGVFLQTVKGIPLKFYSVYCLY